MYRSITPKNAKARGAAAAFFGGAARRAALPVAVFVARAIPALPARFQAEGRYIWAIKEAIAIRMSKRECVDRRREREGQGALVSRCGQGRSFDDRGGHAAPAVARHLSALVHPGPNRFSSSGSARASRRVVRRAPGDQADRHLRDSSRAWCRGAHFFSEENHAVLSDPRVEIIHDDARHFLATTRERFDVITSDPIHPWVRGNSVFFRGNTTPSSRQLKPRASRRVGAALRTSEAAIKIQMRTFMDAFPMAPSGTRTRTAKGTTSCCSVRSRRRASTWRRTEAHRGNAPLAKSLGEAKLGTATDLSPRTPSAPRNFRRVRNTPVNDDFSLKLDTSPASRSTCKCRRDLRRYGAVAAISGSVFVASPEVEKELRARIVSNTPSPKPAP